MMILTDINSLRDVDDDVRTVAASALLPISTQLAATLSRKELSELMDTLWGCLAEGGDELGSSTGAVMDLIGLSLILMMRNLTYT
jgi:TATA-binding protein-associated factor